VIKLEILDYK